MGNIIHSGQTQVRLAPEGFPFGRICAYEQEAGLIGTRLRWVQDRRAELAQQLLELEQHNFSSEDIETLRESVQSRLAGATLSDKRFVLESVGAQVLSNGDGTWEIEVQVPKQISPEKKLQFVSYQPECIPT